MCLIKVLSVTSDITLDTALETFRDLCLPPETLSKEQCWPKTSMDTVSSIRQWQYARTGPGKEPRIATSRHTTQCENDTALSESSDPPARQVASTSPNYSRDCASNQTEQLAREPCFDIMGDIATTFPPSNLIPAVSAAHNDQLVQDPSWKYTQSTLHQRASIIDASFDSITIPAQPSSSTSRQSNETDFPQHLFW